MRTLFVVIGTSFVVIGGILVILAGVLGWVVLPNFIDNKIEETVILEPNGETFDKWKEISLPISLNFYVFNITNPDEYESGTAKPHLEQLGPYIYKQTRTKENLTFSDDLTRVNFTQRIKYVFDDENSGGKESDRVNTLNIGLYLPVYIFWEVFNDPALSGDIAQQLQAAGYGLVSRDVSISSLLFQGMDLNGIVETVPFLWVLFGERPDSKFGYYLDRNNSLGSLNEIDTGKNGHATFGDIISYNGENELPYWGNDTCNAINGSDASIFPPFVKKDRTVKIFTSDLCRSFNFEFEKKMKHRGIPGYKFVLTKESLESPEVNGDNHCFCLRENKDECTTGTLDVGTCLAPESLLTDSMKVPMIMSTPHFLDGAPELRDMINNLKPEKDLHETYIDIEPNSGVLLRANKRIQMNVEIFPFPGIEFLENRNRTILPIFWADEEVSMDEDNADDLKSSLITPLRIVNASKWVVIALGGVLFVSGLLIFIFKR